MGKDKEWLKERVQAKVDAKNGFYDIVTAEKKCAYKDILNLIDQLEEPNVSNETVKDILKANKEMSKRIKELEDELESETNFYTFDDAKKWLEENGYIVTEKEQLYTACFKLKDDITDRGFFLYKRMGKIYVGDRLSKFDKYCKELHFTEKEIKDYDERFWQFAEEVEE